LHESKEAWSRELGTSSLVKEFEPPMTLLWIDVKRSREALGQAKRAAFSNFHLQTSLPMGFQKQRSIRFANAPVFAPRLLLLETIKPKQLQR